jgi:hypothetical protein
VVVVLLCNRWDVVGIGDNQLVEEEEDFMSVYIMTFPLTANRQPSTVNRRPSVSNRTDSEEIEPRDVFYQPLAMNTSRHCTSHLPATLRSTRFV